MVQRITSEEVIEAREKNRKKSISRDLLLDRYETAREFKRSQSEPHSTDSLS